MDPHDGSIHKLNKKLLHKTPAIHPLSDPNRLIFSTNGRSEIFADTYENQFSVDSGLDLPNVENSISPYKIQAHQTPTTLLQVPWNTSSNI